MKKGFIKKEKKYCPFVSVCTPTFNRRPFIPIMFECFNNQTYPKNRIEWIIVDDGTDKINDLIDKSGIEQIKYISIEKKMKLGAKRNLMHSHAKGSIIVYIDDDDYYPPERISHAVERLMENPNILCAGASELYLYYKHINKMFQCGPYGPNHATAGTFAFKKELLKITKYEEDASLAEEKSFLKDYTIPLVQLDPLKTILVFSHSQNTFDKKKMLDRIHPDFFKETTKKIEDFIKYKKEDKIKNFFLYEIDNLLDNYKLGDPQMKPDVLNQMKKIEEDRNKMEKEFNDQSSIMIQTPDGKQHSIQLSDALNIITQQQQFIKNLQNRIEETEKHLNDNYLKMANSKDTLQNENQTNTNLDIKPETEKKCVSFSDPITKPSISCQKKTNEEMEKKITEMENIIRDKKKTEIQLKIKCAELEEKIRDLTETSHKNIILNKTNENPSINTIKIKCKSEPEVFVNIN